MATYFLLIVRCIIKIFDFFNFVRETKLINAGKEEAINQALQQESAANKEANAVRAAADKIYTQDNTDNAFDPSNFRND